MSDELLISLLIVDDHPVVRDGLRGMFESASGFRVLGRRPTGSRPWSGPPTSTRT